MHTQAGTGGQTRRKWPTQEDYEAAIKAAADSSGGLVGGLTFEQGLFGPRMIPGQAGYVFQGSGDGHEYALKVFRKRLDGRASRYTAIHEHLRKAESPIFADFRYSGQGVHVTLKDGRSDWFPAVRMEWCNGRTLETALKETNLDEYDSISWVREWLTVVDELRRTNTAHGDLQHENVFVASDGSMRLIDYDGMFVPAMRGRREADLGHPAYQHPARQAGGGPFDENLDGFSALVILTTLSGLTKEAWETRNDEGLLLTSEDFAKPEGSATFAALAGRPEPTPTLVDLLRRALANPLGPCPELDEAALLFNVELRQFTVSRASRVAPRGVQARSGDEAKVVRERMRWESGLRAIPPRSSRRQDASPTSAGAASATQPPRKPRREHAARATRPKPAPRLSEQQIVSLMSELAGLDAVRMSALRGGQEAVVRKQLTLLSTRLAGNDPAKLLGFRLTARQAEVVELHFAGASEQECAERLGIQPATARRRLNEALRKLDASGLSNAHKLASRLRAATQSRVPVVKLVPPVEVATPPARRPSSAAGSRTPSPLDQPRQQQTPPAPVPPQPDKQGIPEWVLAVGAVVAVLVLLSIVVHFV
jgi:DNA-binding CsgD family transcriptional regulator